MTDAKAAMPLEIGIVLAGKLDAVDHNAVQQAIRRVNRLLETWFPQFEWSLSMHRRPDWGMLGNPEPTYWLRQSAEERDGNHWDLALAITNIDLVGHYRPFAFAAVSRPLDSAVISTLRIDPDQAGSMMEHQERVDTIARRTARLMLHAIGHLAGLRRTEEPHNLMFAPTSASDLDSDLELSDLQKRRMAASLEEIADVRLEEQRASSTAMGQWSFFAKAIWINRRDIFKSVLGARPWEFPRRLSRLTTAAVSTLAVLMLTAEAWDLGLSQSIDHLVLLLAGSLLVTCIHVAQRQQLIMHRTRMRTEQNVSTQVASLGIIGVGMATLWLILAFVGTLSGWFFFDSALVAQWAGEESIHALVHSSQASSAWALYLRMATFTASIGILIGALGASFESQHHFRHIIYVDEEI